MDDATRKRIADALMSGLETAGGAAKGVAGAMFDPHTQAQRMARFATGYDQATGEDLTARPLLPNGENGGRLGEVAAFLAGNMRKPGVPMRDLPMTMGGSVGATPQQQPAAPGMDVNAAYEATKSEDPETRRRAMIIYALRGGA